MDTLRVSMGVDLAACRTTKRWKRWFEPVHLEGSGPNEAVDRFRRLEEAAKFYTSIFRNSKHERADADG